MKSIFLRFDTSGGGVNTLIITVLYNLTHFSNCIKRCFYDYFGTGSRFIKKTYIIYPSDFNCSMNIFGLRPYFSLNKR